MEYSYNTLTKGNQCLKFGVYHVHVFCVYISLCLHTYSPIAFEWSHSLKSFL